MPAALTPSCPQCAAGVVALLALKAGTLLAATRAPKWLEPKRLPAEDAIRLSLLLSGRGEKQTRQDDSKVFLREDSVCITTFQTGFNTRWSCKGLQDHLKGC